MKTQCYSTLDLRPWSFSSIGAAFMAALVLFTTAPRAPGQTGWGNALWLDGFDDHVSVNSGVNLANTSFTLEFRSKQVGISGFQVVVSQGPAEGLHIGFNDGNRATFRLWADDLDATISADWLWHHWAFTYNAPDRARKIFRDGVEVASDTVQVDYPGSGPLLLGRYTSDPAYSFTGILDDFRIWSVARSQAEIAAGIKGPLTGTEPDLVAYWNFDEGTGASVHDATSNGHAGTVSGDPEWMRTTPGGHVLSVSNVNQYIRASIPRLASNYTFSAWVFLRAGGSSSSFPVGVLSAQPSGASAEVLIHGWTGAPATAPQYLHLSRSGAFSGPDSGLRVPTNQWVHVAVTVDASQQVTYFIDGLVAGSWDGSGKDLSIGPSINLADNTGRRFNGLLDEVQIWNIARPQVDIVADYIHARTGTDPNLLASHRFDEGTGSAVYDGVASFPEGALINGPAWIWQSTTVPYPVSLPASGVSLSAAFLHGLVNPNGLETAAWFDWGATTIYENSTTATNVGGGTALVPINATLDALTPGMTYHYRAVGSNNLGVAYGSDRTFSILLVTNANDGAAGSLRQTIAEAASGDIIVLTNTGYMSVCCTEFLLDKDLSIVGPGSGSLALDGNVDSRLFNIRSNVMVSLSGLTIRGGNAPDGPYSVTLGAPGSPGQAGGGIYNAGHLSLNDCVLRYNSAGSGGWGYGDEFASKPVNGGNGDNGSAGGNGGGGGGIYNAKSGVLWLNQCSITGNRTGSGGDGGFGGRGGDSEGVPGAGGTGGAGGYGGSGAGLLNDGQATLKDCTISDNRTGDGGYARPGGRGGNNLPNWLGIHLHWGGNGGYGGTGGSGGSGGGLAGNGQTILINCTLSGNEAGSAHPGGNGGGGGSSGGLASWGHVGGGGNGGDGGTGGGIFNNSSLELLSGTIADNATGLGAAGGLPSTSGTSGGGPGTPGDDGIAGGIRNVSARAASMANTVVALNAGASYPDVAGAFAYHGQNWIGGDPLLGPLANNGGPTWTREPHPTSPLINAGRNLGAPETDQRGLPRIAGGTIDIGACEYQSPQSIISYAWLRQNGLPTDGSADFQDPDGDLMNNWQEWRCGTYPQYDGSVLRMLTPSRTGDGVVVSWECVYDRTYFLQRATNLGESPSFLTLATNLSSEGDTISYTDTNAVGTSFYYRVGVEE